MNIVGEFDGNRNDRTILSTSGNRQETAIKITMLSSINLIPFLIYNINSGSDSIKSFYLFIFWNDVSYCLFKKIFPPLLIISSSFSPRFKL